MESYAPRFSRPAKRMPDTRSAASGTRLELHGHGVRFTVYYGVVRLPVPGLVKLPLSLIISLELFLCKVGGVSLPWSTQYF